MGRYLTETYWADIGQILDRNVIFIFSLDSIGSENDGVSVGLIIGVVVAAVVLLFIAIIIIVVILYWRCRKGMAT